MVTPFWTYENGTIAESRSDVMQNDVGHTFKGMLIRALYEHWSRSRLDSDIANLIEGFLTIQYNTILNLARYPNTNWYSPIWTGPPIPSMLPWGQLAAIDVFNSVIGLADESINTTSPTPGISALSKSGPPVGQIVGGTIGGAFGLILCATVVYIILRRRNQTRNAGAEDFIDSSLFQKGLVGEAATQKPDSDAIEPFPPPLSKSGLTYTSEKLSKTKRYSSPRRHPAPSNTYTNPDSSWEPTQSSISRFNFSKY
ncbi:hypothetical protein QCA50_008118 [Cerrena zonata]|uniref:Epidermal growth factor receptor-like transmembrane-juxtamembrane segment domain-containing protein n=1 Tax=Cerrena zonata TaxID=2478898 RepID=A0AAW0GBQ4_9APHY